MVKQDFRDELRARISIKCAAKGCERAINLSKTFLNILCEYERDEKFTVSSLKFFCRECSEDCLDEYKEVNELMKDKKEDIIDLDHPRRVVGKSMVKRRKWGMV